MASTIGNEPEQLMSLSWRDCAAAGQPYELRTLSVGVRLGLLTQSEDHLSRTVMLPFMYPGPGTLPRWRDTIEPKAPAFGRGYTVKLK